MNVKIDNSEFAKEMAYCVGLMADSQMIYDKSSQHVFLGSFITLIMVALHSFIFHGRFSIGAILMLIPAVCMAVDVLLDVVVMFLCLIQMRKCKKYIQHVVKAALITSIIGEAAAAGSAEVSK